MNISAQQISDFHRDGFILLKGVLSPDEIRAMRETFSRLPPAQQKSFYLFELPGLENLVGLNKQLTRVQTSFGPGG